MGPVQCNLSYSRFKCFCRLVTFMNSKCQNKLIVMTSHSSINFLTVCSVMIGRYTVLAYDHFLGREMSHATNVNVNKGNTKNGIRRLCCKTTVKL